MPFCSATDKFATCAKDADGCFFKMGNDTTCTNGRVCTATGATASHAYAAPGHYVASVTVRDAMDSLSPAHREVIRLAHYGGLTLREIAERKGIPLGTVKSRTSYALRSLRLILDEMEVAS